MRSGEVSHTRSITHTMVWSDNGVRQFDDHGAFVFDFYLNDSDSSQLGPGIYLDMDLLEIDSDFPGFYVHSQFSIFPYEKRIAVGAARPTELIANTVYSVWLNSAPGTAVQDNANIEVMLGYKLFRGCQARWCVFDRMWCRVNGTEWGAEPIPGTYSWVQPPEMRCYHWIFAYLPFVNR